MNSLIKHIGILLLTLTCSLAFAQEECNNGQDDDGDGQVDCADGDCQFAADRERGCNCNDDIDNDGDGQVDEVDPDCAGFYGLSFVGESASECAIQPNPSEGTFDFVNPSYSGQNTVDTQSKIAVGDMNCDGIPDVVTTSKWNQNLRIIATSDNQPDGSDKGDVIQAFKTTGSNIFPKGNFFFELEVLIADIDGSCPAEIFSIVSNRKNADSEPTQYYLVGFSANSSPSNSSLVPLFDAVPLGPDRPGEITIADLDCDQNPEIILKDQVFDAATGALLADGNAGNWNTEVTSAPVAIDIIDGGNLEIVSGNKILSYPDMTVIADMNSLGGDQWFPKEIFDANEYGFDNFSSTSVADMNNDGNLDVVLSGALGSKNGKTAIFFWDVTNGTVASFLPDDPEYADGWIWGTSRPNLGDIDGDGQLEITFIAGTQLFAMEVDPNTGALTEKWRRTINDSRSGVISTTVYDFDNDGSPEIVYRDSQQLVVIDGETGQEVLWSVSCQSHTMTEGPVIADVDGDGATDICTTCNTNNSFDIEAGIQQQALGELRCFFSQNNNWLPTRGVWNQSGYYVTNIADDLSVPCPRFDMTTAFSDSPCSNGAPGPQTPLNTFMNQVPTLAADGCPYYPAPDISFIGNDPNDPNADPNDPDYFPAVNFMPPVCGDLGVGVSFNFINSGGMTISTQVPVSFWEGNPTVEVDPDTGKPANFLHLDYINLLNFQVRDTVTTDTTNFDYSGSPTTLYIVLNDDGTTFPVDTTSNEGKDLQECNLDNNIYAFEIMPQPFSIDIEHISDNFKCDNDSPNNGELRGVVKRDGVEVSDYSPYAFQWYYGSDTTNQVPDPDGKEPSLTDLDDGIYSLAVTNTNKGCSSLPVSDTIVRRGVDPTITILINSDQTYCYPPNGELEVIIEGGVAGYSFEWFDNNLSPLGVTGPVAGDLTEGEWIVDVTKDGCTKRASQTINGPTEPDVTASVTQHIVNCADMNSGEVTAEPFINGIAQNPDDYEFDWYIYDNATGTLGSILPPENGTGPTRIDLPEGHYAVVATETISGCESAPPQVVEVLDQTVYPQLVIAEIAPQTSCDPDNPNGILEVEISMGGTVDSPSNYTIEWFRGDNTLPENLYTTTSGVNGERALEIEGGGVPYTVKVTTANNCFTTASYIITEDTVVPVVTLSKIDNSICDPSLASSEYNGQVTAAVSFRGTNVTLPDAGYEFTWYDGNSISSPVIPVADNTAPSIDKLDAGLYTVEVTKTDVYCTSVAVTIEVVDASVDPTATIVEDIQQTSCDPSVPNAQITASAATGGTVSANGYTYKWYTGTGTGNVFVDGTDGTISGTDGETISGIAARTYTVQVTDKGNGCQSITSYTVADNTQNPVVTIGAADITANGICNPALTNPVKIHNGAIDASNATYNSVGVTLSDYRYDWYEGSTVKSSPDSTGQGGSGGEVLSNLSAGYYTVTITRTVPGEGFGCTSDPVTVEVPDASVDPTVSIVEDIPLSSCDPDKPNAQITADALTGGSASVEGYVYKWYVGSGTALPFLDGTHGTGGNTKTISGIAANTYTVLVTDNATGCQNTASFDVVDKTQNPVVTIGAADITANTVCDPALTDPAVTNNGAIDASDATYNGIAVTLSDYRYDWYVGSAVKASTDYSAQGGSGGEVWSNRAPGFYTVTVTRTVPGEGFACTSDPVTIEVPDASVDPTATIVEDLQQTSCDTSAPNARLTASAQTGGASSAEGYTYEWFIGSGTGTAFEDGTDGTISGTDGETISEIAANTYTVQVTDNGSGCQTIINYTVVDNTQNPVVTIGAADITANTVCDPALTNPPVDYNGAIDASNATYNGVAINPSDYRYDWYYGNAVKATADYSAQGGSGGEQWTNRPPGEYTVTITRTVAGEGFGCTSDPVIREVPDASVIPTSSITIDQQQTSCDPASPNGQLTASALTGGSPSSYAYDWYVGSGTGTPFVAGTDGAISGPAGETISNLSSRTYTVMVTDLATGCQQIASKFLPESISIPEITLNSMTQNTVCNPAQTSPVGDYNGELVVNVSDPNPVTFPNASYEFTWYDGGEATGTPRATVTGNPNLGLLPGGEYTVVVRNITTSCESVPFTVEVTDNLTYPTIATTTKNQTSCDPAAPNGEVDAVIGGGSTYDITWFEGGGTGGTVIQSTTSASSLAATGLASGNYTVRAVDNATGCSTERIVYVNEVIVKPEVSLAVTTGMTDCTFDGVITPTVDNSASIPAPSGYRFDWYRGTDTSGGIYATTFDDGVNTPELSTANTGLDIYSDFYTVIVTDIDAACASEPVTTYLDRPNPLFAIEGIINYRPSFCSAAEGILSAYVDLNNNGSYDAGEADYAQYKFEWYEGVPTDPDANYYTDPEPTFVNPKLDVNASGVYPGSVPASTTSPYFAPDGTDGATIYGYQDGRYTVVITDLSNGCKEFRTLDLPFAGAQQIVNVGITNSTSCANPNGELEITSIEVDGVAQNLNDYTFDWYEGNNEDSTKIIVDGSGTPISGPVLDQISGVPGLPAAYYTVVAVQAYSPFCRANPVTVFVDSAARQPDVVPTLAHNTSCSNSDGSITVTASPDPDDTAPSSGTYSYQWTSANTIQAGEDTTATITQLAPGDYTVTVTDDNSGCFITKTYTILDQPVYPDIVSITATDNTMCTPNEDGTLVINDADVTSGDVDDYSFEVYFGGSDAGSLMSPQPPTTAGATSLSFDNLAPGMYYVTAERVNPGPGYGCVSIPVQADEVIDSSTDPVLTPVITADNDCDPNQNGSLEVTADAASPSAGTYTFEWFVGTNTSTPFVDGTDGTIVAPGAGTENTGSITEVLHGNYTVRITDPVTNCIKVKPFTVPYSPEAPEIDGFDITHQQRCGSMADGAITVTSLTIGAASDYDYEWYASVTDYNNANPLAASTAETITGLPAGTYYVLATKKSGSATGEGCPTPLTSVTIDDNTVKPVLELTQTANTSCDNTFDGTLTINVSDASGPGIGGPYTYDITFNGAPYLTGETTNLGVNDTYDSLQNGVYVVTATNEVTTCSVTETISVQYKPQEITFTTMKTDLEYCSPNGTPAPSDPEYANISVTGITPGGLSDYTYSWYHGLTNFNAGTAITTATGTELNVSNYPGITAGTYYVVANRNPGTNPGSGCESPAVEVIIIDNSLDPEMTLSQTANTACDANYDGTLTINVSDPPGSRGDGAPYTYNISLGGTVVVSDSSGNSGAGEVFTDLQNGSYEVTATNELTTCSVTKIISVQHKPQLITLTTVKNDLVYCSPSGNPAPTDAQYANISVNSISPGNLADYTYSWYEGLANLNAGTAISGVNTPDLNLTTYPGIGAGKYYVIANRNPGTNPGSACTSSAVEVIILDNSVDPEMTLSQTPNTSCDGNFDGSITINVDDSGPGAGATFTYDFTKDGAAYPGGSTGNTGSGDVLAGLQEGTYTVTATNEITTCSVTKTISIRHNPEPIDVVTVINENQDICDPDGRIEVQVVDPGALADFTFEWYYADMSSAPLEDQVGNPINGLVLEAGNAAGQYPLMGAGTYYIVARKNANIPPGSNCESAPYRVVVEDLSEDPVLTFNQPKPDITCSGENPTGKIEVTSSQDVAFTWAADIDGDGIFGEAGDDDIPATAMQTPAPGVTGPTSTYDSLPEGNYRVTALNTTSGCAVTGEMAIVRNPKLGEPNILNIEVVHPKNCNGSGTMKVTSVSIGGAAPVTDSIKLAQDFMYEWMDASGNNLGAGDTTSYVDGLTDGQYFVNVMSRKTGCSSIEKEVNVLGDEIIYPVIDLQLTIPQIVCNGDIRPFSAELEANVEEADGNVDTYTFEWFYEGAAGLPAGASVSETSVSSTASNLPVGRYTVVVSNDSSSCKVSDFYIIRDKSERYKPQVSTSSEPLTKCSGPNGSVLLANVGFPADYPYPADYTVDWYIGDDPDMTAAPDYPATDRVSNLPDGLYTIRVTDNNTGCSVREVQDIRDERVMPVIAVTVDNPQTTCPPYNPNGQLTATADGRVGGYTFEWFEGPQATGNIISSKNRLTGFPAGEYTVRVTNNFTGCITLLTDKVTDGRLVPPSPDPELKKNLTSCVDPDGRLAVSVDGAVQGYSFAWYEGTEASGTVFSDRSDVIGLDMGMYTVTATDLVSGCISEGVSIEVGDERELPEFEFSTVGSKCDDDTGSATIAITNNTVASEVVWTAVESGFSLGLGTDLYDVPPGIYEAEVTTFMGCVNSEQVEIGTVITSYNLVSADGDGINDNFQIDCITEFPNNNIKIYNRNGVLVFEMDGYNNADKSFEGIGANGLYSMGDKLPNGTYFYVIDKGDGSELVSGFLELIR